MSKKIATSEYLKLQLYKTLLPDVIIDTILHYTNSLLMLDYEDNKTVFVNTKEFNLLDRRNIKKISIYGVIVLINPVSMFLDSKIQSITGNVILIGDSSKMFYNADKFVGDVSNWDTSQVTNMSWMFYCSRKFTTEKNDCFGINSWDTSKVKNMKGMFYHSENFNQDISSWNTSNVKDMSYMFNYAEKFNQDINSWDTSQVIFMNQMFDHATSFNQEIGNWNVSNVITMRSMFHSAINFNSNISNWDTRNIKDFSWMFLNSVNFDQDIRDWDLSKVRYKNGIFHNAKKFKGKIVVQTFLWIFGSYYKIVF
jgi:surface protein